MNTQKLRAIPNWFITHSLELAIVCFVMAFTFIFAAFNVKAQKARAEAQAQTAQKQLERHQEVVGTIIMLEVGRALFEITNKNTEQEKTNELLTFYDRIIREIQAVQTNTTVQDI